MQNVKFLPISVLFGVLFYLAALFLRKPKKILSIDFVRSFLCAYVVLMIQIVLLSREPGTRISVDLIPGSTWTQDSQGRAYVIENVLLFIPYGVLLPLSFQKIRLRWIVLMGFFTSVLIELVQYMTGRGYLQVDDVIMNTVGMILGAGLVSVLRRLAPSRDCNVSAT